jgi:hypothetical protein
MSPSLESIAKNAYPRGDVIPFLSTVHPQANLIVP